MSSLWLDNNMYFNNNKEHSNNINFITYDNIDSSYKANMN
jgi:hypothetical protein